MILSETDSTKEDSEDLGEDFASLFESGRYDRETRIQTDTKVEGSVVSIGEEWVFVDIGAKTEACIARDELLDDEGVLTAKIGDTLAGYVVSTKGGEILLSRKMTAVASEDAMRSACRSGIPVEGLVIGERKGGYTVSVFGKQAFCPFSQIDIPPIADSSDYVNRKFLFRITQYAEGGRNIVLTRRSVLDEERAQKVALLKESLRVGDILQGCVCRTAQFGAFVDIGGIDGLVPLSEMSWERVSNASEVVTAGDSVTVKILDLDWDNKRISLSMKQAKEDPWDSALERHKEQGIADGVVTKLMNFGAFVQLEPGIEGLIHISNLAAGRRINHPREAVSEGDKVQVRILSVDPQARRIGLELVPSEGLRAQDASEIQEGDVLVGTIEAIKDYGAFVGLPGGKSGLLHLSEVASQGKGDVRARLTVGSPIEVQVLKVDEASGRISLSTKSLERHDEEENVREFSSKRESKSSFGTLGDLLRKRSD